MYLNSIGKYEDRLKNLYFIYAAVMRAVHKAEYLLRESDYSTGINDEEDKQSH